MLEIISNLKRSQKGDLIKTLEIADYPRGEEDKTIFQELVNHACEKAGKDEIDPWLIIEIWLDYLKEILDEMEKAGRINSETKYLKSQVQEKIREILDNDECTFDDIEAVVRHILTIFIKNMDPDSRTKLVDALEKDAEKYNQHVTKAEIDAAFNEMLLKGGVTSALTLLGPILAAIIYQRLTAGITAYIMINILGRASMGVLLAEVVSGPIGWGIAIGTLVWLVGDFFGKYSEQKAKGAYIQCIFNIFSFNMVNRMEDEKND